MPIALSAMRFWTFAKTIFIARAATGRLSDREGQWHVNGRHDRKLFHASFGEVVMLRRDRLEELLEQAVFCEAAFGSDIFTTGVANSSHNF